MAWGPRLLKSVSETLNRMQTCYDQLTGYLTDATVHPEKVNAYLGCCYLKAIVYRLSN